MRLAGGWDDEWFGLEYPASSRIYRGDRARLNAREGSGALNAGQAWKMAARWHELVGAQQRGRVSGEHRMPPGQRRCGSIGRAGLIFAPAAWAN